jgi:hypothetical protein
VTGLDGGQGTETNESHECADSRHSAGSVGTETVTNFDF